MNKILIKKNLMEERNKIVDSMIWLIINFPELSVMELDIARYTKMGFTRKRIADFLHISLSELLIHIKNIEDAFLNHKGGYIFLPNL